MSGNEETELFSSAVTSETNETTSFVLNSGSTMWLKNKQKKELMELREHTKTILKGVGGKQRAILEAQEIQREMDLQARHRNDMDMLEEQMEAMGIIADSASVPVGVSLSADASIEAKRDKARKKKEKKAVKSSERQITKEALRLETGTSVSARDLELGRMNDQLAVKSLKVKEVLADGNCLYR